MDCSIEVVRRNIRRFDDLEQGRNFFLEQMRGVARATIETAENIILIGATPFAKKIFKMREEIFPSKKVVLVDNRSELDLNWGGVFILCSRPNVGRHLEWLKDMEAVMQYQCLLTLFPQLSMDPYAYQYEKIERQIDDVITNWNYYEMILRSLKDAMSQELFKRMLLYRLTYDVSLHKDIATKYPHYFDEDVFSLRKDEIFIDCGGYNGDTLKSFKEMTGGSFKKYYLFEPDTNLMDEAIKVGNNDPRILYYNQGVWDNNIILSFKKETSAGNGSVVLENQSERVIHVPVTSLDEVVKEATYIKMDVEGAEFHALRGARKLINRCLPVLAVCVYHKYEDYIELYKCIKALGKYDIYLRAQYNNIDMELYYLCIPADLKHQDCI